MVLAEVFFGSLSTTSEMSSSSIILEKADISTALQLHYCGCERNHILWTALPTNNSAVKKIHISLPESDLKVLLSVIIKTKSSLITLLEANTTFWPFYPDPLIATLRLVAFDISGSDSDSTEATHTDQQSPNIITSMGMKILKLMLPCVLQVWVDW